MSNLPNGSFNQIDANVVKLKPNTIKNSNGIPFMIPSNQGASQTILSNDGAGNLSWRPFWLPILGIAGAIPLRLPATVGTAGDFLVSDGNGNLLWKNISTINTVPTNTSGLIVSSSNNIVMNSLDTTVVCTSSGNAVVTLPPASSVKGKYVTIVKDVQDGTIKVQPSTASELIEGNNSIVLTFCNEKIKLVSNGSNKWYIL